MTRDEAIECLSERISIGKTCEQSCMVGFGVNIDTLDEAFDMAISALRHQDVTDKYVGKMTNAQKIRAMSDDELAEFLEANAEYCHVGLCKDGETCRICCLNWLQMPAEEDDHA